MSNAQIKPPRYAFDGTPSDSADLTYLTTGGFLVKVAGDYKVDMAAKDNRDGTPATITVTLPGLIVGIPYPYVIRRVYTTGSVASADIIGFYYDEHADKTA